MKKIFYFVALATLSLTSCSNDEVLNLQKDQIKLNVFADNGSRASELFNSGEIHSKFYVSAVYKENVADEYFKCYFHNDEIALEGGSWVNKTVSERYWPEDENMTLDFIALNTQKISSNPVGQFGTFMVQYNVNEDVTKQEDLMYAVAKGQSKKANNGAGVNLNFRHALSQIVFNAENDNSSLKVVIKSITINNISSVANFNFDLSADAGDTQEQYTQDAKGYAVKRPMQVSPMYYTQALKDYTVDFEDVTILGEGFADLTLGNKDLTMLLIPQTRTAWDEATENVAETNNAYFAVDYDVYNIGKDANGTEIVDHYTPIRTGVKYVPVTINWEAGHKYIYTLRFLDLDKIVYNVTVDDFVAAPVDNGVNMN